jgi:hypothetical protein
MYITPVADVGTSSALSRDIKRKQQTLEHKMKTKTNIKAGLSSVITVNNPKAIDNRKVIDMALSK